MNVLSALATPKSHLRKALYHLSWILGGSLFLGLMAQLSLPLWFTPVPLSMLSLGVLIVGAILGSRKGALAVLAFLAEGASGLPFFGGFSSGLPILFGATGGYLFGCVVAAFVVGFFFERGCSAKYLLLALLLGSAIILTAGALWLGCIVGFQSAFALGFYPFILGDLLKVGAAATLLPIVSRWKQ